MMRLLAFLFGAAFIFAGVAGYLPQFVENDLLFGLFEVNNVHNLIHLVTGAVAILASTSYRLTKVFFALFGLIYTAVAILGFWNQGDLYLLHVNNADNIFHIVVGCIALYLGFSRRHVVV